MHAHKYLALFAVLYSISGVSAAFVPFLSTRDDAAQERKCSPPPGTCTTHPDNCCLPKTSCWESDHVSGMDWSPDVREIWSYHITWTVVVPLPPGTLKLNETNNRSILHILISGPKCLYGHYMVAEVRAGDLSSSGWLSEMMMEVFLPQKFMFIFPFPSS